jgi:hypothetical protein
MVLGRGTSKEKSLVNRGSAVVNGGRGVQWVPCMVLGEKIHGYSV